MKDLKDEDKVKIGIGIFIIFIISFITMVLTEKDTLIYNIARFIAVAIIVIFVASIINLMALN